ncbi:endolytic transglycosylase MltG [Haloimpatiens sp. FM7330]|uniref:endolytic transglycosylase MltG n=1 Tax=Haloimpatiens sp. FM7330 TaxID=3298610 RepID=UPI003638A6D6
MKKKILLVVAILSISIVIGYIKIRNTLEKPFNVNNKYVFNIQKGENFNKVISKLSKDGIVKNTTIIKGYVKFTKSNLNIKVGKYEVNKDMSLQQFINMLNKGSLSHLVKVTIPEGYNIDQIGKVLEENKVITKDDFIKSCKQYKLPGYIKQNSNRKYDLEGYIFPDTYGFEENMKGEKIITIMVNRFEKVFSEFKNINNIKDDEMNKIVTLASIVEKEIKSDGERGKAASVFYNRLNKNMKLQSCATVLYALGYHKDKLYNKDLNVSSPYNTYKISGLTPGPICSPGKNSLKAAMNPDKTNFLYFVSKNDGTHFFTSDYNEFLKVKKVTQGF